MTRIPRNNPFAPPVYQGLGQAQQLETVDMDFRYVFDITLTANQLLRTQKPVHDDSDFCWRAMFVNSSTGLFQVQFTDSDSYFLSDGFINSTNIQGDASQPWAVAPEIIIPAGGRIGIYIQDLSGAGNTIQILFLGAKRYVVAQRER